MKTILFLLAFLLIGCSSIPQEICKPIVGVESAGTGVIVEVKQNPVLDEVYILTAYHLLPAETTQCFVATQVFFEIYDPNGCSNTTFGIVFKTDKHRDLALIKAYVPSGWAKKTKISKQKPCLGDKLYAVGYPFGNLIITQGISGRYEWDTKAGVYTGGVAMGNSGGGIFNENGELVGIVSRCMAMPMEATMVEDGKNKKVLQSYPVFHICLFAFMDDKDEIINGIK